jgi:hypothetical protein
MMTFGSIVQLFLDALKISSISGFNLALGIFLAVGNAFAILMMFLGRWFLGDEESRDDEDTLYQGFDFLFMAYGCFVVFTTVWMWLYYRFDPSSFGGTGISFWTVAFYVFDLAIRGFLQDVMEYMHIDPVLKPTGVLYHVAFAVKILMAFTVVSGALKFLERAKGGIEMLLR